LKQIGCIFVAVSLITWILLTSISEPGYESDYGYYDAYYTEYEVDYQDDDEYLINDDNDDEDDGS
jgi:hypothetical protein